MNKFEIMQEIEKLNVEEQKEIKDWLDEKVIRDLSKRFDKGMKKLKRML